jgi:hypothetical protein
MEKDMNAEKDEKISTETAVELLVAAMERQVKRWFIICVVIFTALVLTNGFWIWRESQYEDVITEITQENADGINNFIGNDGDIYNGETDDKDQKETKENGR